MTADNFQAAVQANVDRSDAALTVVAGVSAQDAAVQKVLTDAKTTVVDKLAGQVASHINEFLDSED